MSVAGGVSNAVERAVVHGCEALQIFAKNASQWRGRIVPPEEVREFRARVKASGIQPVVSHARTNDPSGRKTGSPRSSTQARVDCRNSRASGPPSAGMVQKSSQVWVRFWK